MTPCTVFAGGKSPWADPLPEPEPQAKELTRAMSGHFARGLGSTSIKVLRYLHKNPWTRADQIAVDTRINQRAVHNSLKCMHLSGRLVRTESKLYAYAVNPECEANIELRNG